MKDKTIALTAAQVLQVRKELNAIWIEEQRKADWEERCFWDRFNESREETAMREYEESMINAQHVNNAWQQTLDDAFSGELEDDTDFPC